MNAEILAIGSELLTATKIDTNSLWLTDQLNAMGVEVVGKSVVGDDRARLTDALRGALSRAELVFVTGGLGPTEDDVTRDAVAAALGRGQVYREDLCEDIAARFRRLNRPMAENNKRQAWIVEGAEAMPNDRGTAPGQWVPAGDGRVIVLLPGPPREMKAMFELQCLSRLQTVLPPAAIAVRHYRIARMGESDVDQLIAPVYTKYTNPVTTILASAGEIQVFLRGRAATAEAAEGLLVEPGVAIEELLGERIFSTDGRTLEAVVGDLLVASGKTLAVAESLTGGGLGARITSVAGSSRHFSGGIIAYSDAVKESLLGVPGELIAEHSAVSEPVVKAMAEGVRSATGADFGVALTGYAGPDALGTETPVGTVFIGIADGSLVGVSRCSFGGDRDRIRALTLVWALDLVRMRLLERQL